MDTSINQQPTLPPFVHPCAPGIHRIPITAVNPGTRLRQEYGDLPGMIASIQENGQLQPIGLNQNGELIWGGRRYFAHVAAVEMYASEENPDAETLAALEKFSYINVVYMHLTGEAQLRKLELEENLRRKDMTWQETIIGFLQYHQISEREANLAGKNWTMADTGAFVGLGRARIAQLLPLARIMMKNTDSPLWRADSIEGAIRMALDLQATAAKQLLAKTLQSTGIALTPVVSTGTTLSSQPRAGTITVAGAGSAGGVAVANALMGGLAASLNSIMPGGAVQQAQPVIAVVGQPAQEPSVDGITADLSIPDLQVLDINLAERLLIGDCRTHRALVKGKIHHIITDAPFAIDMDNLQQSNTGMDVSATVNEHDVEENLKLLKDLVPFAFDVLPDKGFFITFCDIMHFRWLHDLGVQAGFAVQRWPLHWCKPQAQNSAAGFNFTKAVEHMIVMRKEGTTLAKHGGLNWMPCSNNKGEFTHPFTKPFDVLKWLIEAVSQEGQTIYDPFCGTGSGPVAALQTGRNFMASERAEQHVYEALTHLTKAITKYWAPAKNVKVNVHFTPAALAANTSTNHDETTNIPTALP